MGIKQRLKKLERNRVATGEYLGSPENIARFEAAWRERQAEWEALDTRTVEEKKHDEEQSEKRQKIIRHICGEAASLDEQHGEVIMELILLDDEELNARYAQYFGG